MVVVVVVEGVEGGVGEEVGGVVVEGVEEVEVGVEVVEVVAEVVVCKNIW